MRYCFAEFCFFFIASIQWQPADTEWQPAGCTASGSHSSVLAASSLGPSLTGSVYLFTQSLLPLSSREREIAEVEWIEARGGRARELTDMFRVLSPILSTCPLSEGERGEIEGIGAGESKCGWWGAPLPPLWKTSSALFSALGWKAMVTCICVCFGWSHRDHTYASGWNPSF